MIERVHSTGLQSQHTVAKTNTESCSLLAAFLERVAWSSSRFKTKIMKNFFTQHIIVSLNSVAQDNAK